MYDVTHVYKLQKYLSWALGGDIMNTRKIRNSQSMWFNKQIDGYTNAQGSESNGPSIKYVRTKKPILDPPFPMYVEMYGIFLKM